MKLGSVDARQVCDVLFNPFQKKIVPHCKCLQGFTGSLQGNQSVGISNLWGLPVNHNPCNFEIPTLCNICRGFDFTGILWGYPTLVLGKSCNIYGETM